jgi:hypothetical protein
MLLTVHLIERVRLCDGMWIEFGATRKGEQRCDQRKQSSVQHASIWMSLMPLGSPTWSCA